MEQSTVLQHKELPTPIPKISETSAKREREIIPGDDWYINDKGYWCGGAGFPEIPGYSHSELIHRQIAYWLIYLPNKEMFSLSFRKYVVHHIDLKKLNNDLSNLRIMIKEEHDELHDEINELEIEDYAFMDSLNIN